MMQKPFGLFHFSADFTHPGVVWISKIGVTLWVCGASSPLTIIPAPPKLPDYPAAVWQTGDCSIHNWLSSCIKECCNYQKYGLIIPRPVPWDQLMIGVTHPFPSHVRIHIGDGKAIWLEKTIWWGITLAICRRRPVDGGFVLIIIGIYASSVTAKEAVW